MSRPRAPWWIKADGMLCLAKPNAARWTVVGIDTWTGADIPMPDVRFRWRRSAEAFVTYATESSRADYGYAPRMAPRRLATLS